MRNAFESSTGAPFGGKRKMEKIKKEAKIQINAQGRGSKDVAANQTLETADVF